jgi:hypothetical protein
MRANSHHWLAVGLLMWMACQQRQPAALVGSDAGIPPPAVQAGGRASTQVLARCHADLDRVVRGASHFYAAPQRVRELLAGLSTACVEVLPTALREGTAEAASLRGVERAHRLIEAARAFVPEDCLAPVATMAWAVESRCPPPEDTGFARPLPRTLDMGSYVYALALRAQLHARGAYDERAERWVAEFLLRSALEGEEQGAH